MNIAERRNKFEGIMNSIEEAKYLAEELEEELLIGTFDNILSDLEDKYNDDYANPKQDVVEVKNETSI